MTATQHLPQRTTSPDDARVRRCALIVGVSIVVLALAWWFSPVLGGVLTIAASLVLARSLAPGRTDIGPRRPAHDFRNDGGRYL
jgi:hypothetical protein